MARNRGLIAGAILLVLAAAVAVALWQQRRVERAETEAGLASARVLTATFERTSALQVAKLTGAVTADTRATSALGWVENRQTTRAPYAVTYTVDLRGLDATALRWNAEARTMTVDIPDVIVGKPAVDMARARIAQSGLYISRSAGQQLQREAAGRLSLAAETKARDPENVAKAREAARAAVGNLVRAPLAAAGLGDVRVAVRLPSEARPEGLSQEQWDVSTSLAEIYARHPASDERP